MLLWLKQWRRRRLLATPFPERWYGYLSANVHYFAELSDGERAKLCDDLRIIVAEKSWEGCEGLVVTEEMKVTVAAQASLLVLGIEPSYFFDRTETILIYPKAFSRAVRSQTGIVDEGGETRLGEAWHEGPIVLSWPDVLMGGRGANDGRNLVMHEFAHHLDRLDGEMGGTPPIQDEEQRKRWRQVVDREYLSLCHAVRQGIPTLLDPYAATNKAEFFAVSTECFFELPRDLRAVHSELYEVLRDFYHQDPAVRES